MAVDNPTPQESNETGNGDGSQPQSQEKTPETQPKQPVISVAEFKALQDRDRTVREREQKLKAAEREIEQYKRLPQLAKEKPLEALRTLGIPYEDLVKRVSQGERPDPVEPVKSEVQQLKEMVQRLYQDREEQERMTVAQKAQQGIREYVGSSEDFPLTKHLEASDMVFDYLQNHKQATGEWLSEEDAAREVEAYLSGLVEKALELDSIKSKLTGTSKTSQSTPHISNTDASKITVRSDEMSEDDKYRMALKLLSGGGA